MGHQFGSCTWLTRHSRGTAQKRAAPQFNVSRHLFTFRARHQTMKKILPLTLMFVVTTVLAQDAVQKEGCAQPKPPSQHRPAQEQKPGVSVQCGANTITQTYPTALAASSDATAKDSNVRAEGTSLWIALIAGASGVLGALAGALVSLIVARKNAQVQLQLETMRLRANVVTEERLRWLQDIRTRLSKLYREMDMQYSHLKRPVPTGQQAQVQQTLDAMSAEVMEQCNIVTLMLNPTKPDQADLRNALQSALAFIQNCFAQPATGIQSFNDQQYQSIKQSAFDALTRVGIQTWGKIKELE